MLQAISPGPPRHIRRDTHYSFLITKCHQAKSPPVKPSQTHTKLFPQSCHSEIGPPTSGFRPRQVSHSTLFHPIRGGGALHQFKPGLRWPQSSDLHRPACGRWKPAQNKKITKRTHFEFFNPPINTADFQPSVSNHRKKRTHFGQPDTYKRFGSTNTSKMSKHWQTIGIHFAT